MGQDTLPAPIIDVVHDAADSHATDCGTVLPRLPCDDTFSGGHKAAVLNSDDMCFGLCTPPVVARPALPQTPPKHFNANAQPFVPGRAAHVFTVNDDDPMPAMIVPGLNLEPYVVVPRP